jgi:serine/threonine-protein kinase
LRQSIPGATGAPIRRGGRLILSVQSGRAKKTTWSIALREKAMTIRPGTRFGSYDVVEPIGFGGMGEVYRAVDTQLGRDVAIKVLPPSFSDDATRVARFEQEARTLASLNHANIAHIYGLERSDGSMAIVMELVDGETLADRLVEGPVAVAEALRIGGQLADALEAAHARAIVHRDLKPANIKLKPDGTVKVLDFGIAKAFDPRLATGAGPAALTTPAMTAAGVVLGTAAYMSPEQARGKAVDQRTDVWAFGCVLYEMLTGKHAFLGEDVTSTLARVLEVPPNFAALPANVPPAVRRTLELCLEKDPHKRIADMRDVKLALAGTFETGAVRVQPQARSSRLAAAVVAAAVLAATAAWLLKPAPVAEPRMITRFEYTLPPGVDFRDTMTSVLGIAPNGEAFAFNGTGGIYVRRMDGTETRLLPGTNALAPNTVAPDVVFSPNGREVAFFRGPPGQLLRTAIDGGAPIVVANVLPAFPFGLSWEADGTLYYGQLDGIWRVSQNGGTPERLIETEAPQQVYGPRLLPGGEWLLFTLAKVAGENRWNEADIVIQSLATGERRVLRSGGFDARYLPTGHITYMSDHVMFASTFDIDSLTLGAERVPVVQDVEVATPAAGGSGFYAVANNGTLLSVRARMAKVETARPQKRLVWVDRAGNATPLPLQPDNYMTARLSPDGTKIALVVGNVLPVSDPPPDIYVFDLATENLSQLTFNPYTDDGPLWSRDGTRIYYRSWEADGNGSRAAIYSLPADGGDPEFVARSESTLTPLPWSLSADGKTLLIVDAVSLEDINLSKTDLAENATIEVLLDGVAILSEPALSPNGQWLLYHENGSANPPRPEINIRPYPDVRQQRRPVAVGTHPMFAADGSELFFFDGEGLSVAPVQYTPFRVGAVRPLFRGRYWYGVGGEDGRLGRAWDVDSRNDRFLLITLPEDQSPPADPSSASAQARIDVVLNWFDELERRVPQR